jgi:FkbM family methyltransferase
MQQEVDLPAQPVEARNRVSRLDVGEAGVRQGVAIKFRAGLLGCVARGSLGYLKPGRYRLVVGIRSRPNSSAGHDTGILIELITSSRLISVHVLTSADLRNPHREFVFDVPEQATDVELRISALSSVEATVDDVGVESLGGRPERPLSHAVRLHNWLPLLDVGPAGNRSEFGVEAEQGFTDALEGCSGWVICGPRWPLPPGRYTMTAVIELSEADAESGAIGRLEVAADATPIASADIRANQAVRHPVVLSFEVAQSASDGFSPLIETRIFSNGTVGFCVRSIKVEPEQTASAAGIKFSFGNLLARPKALLPRPLERAVARSIDPQIRKLRHAIRRIEADQQRAVEKLSKFQIYKNLIGLEDHLLESYGSAPSLHPIGGWHVGTGIDNPTSLHKDRVRKWKALTQPSLLMWHADLKVMLWPKNENSRALFITGNFEPSEMSWLADNLKDDMVFIDVGANMGIYTMFAAKLVGAGGRVLAVEPSEREFQRLSFHVVLNDLGNVTCLRIAAADKAGVGELNVAGEEKSGHNTLGKFVSESTEVLRIETVPIYPLDQVIAEHELERVDVIKIDVEGAELRVLRGLAGTIERWRPKLLIELAPEALAGQNTSPEALVEWLRDRRYELFEFSPTTGELQEFQSASVEHISKNFVAIPYVEANRQERRSAGPPDSSPTDERGRSDNHLISPAWRENAFALLAEKWHEVPVTHQDRSSTRAMLELSDEELLAVWSRRAAATAGQKGLGVGDWEYYAYRDLFKGRNVIEVGPGLGVLGVSFLEYGARMTFIDVVEPNLKLIERVCRLKGLHDVKFLHLTRIEDLTRLEAEYDAVFAHGSLHHAPAEVIKPEFTALASRLKTGGRFIMLAYPKSRWEREGSPAFSEWGKMTDGEATPWAEWYDLAKLLEQLAPHRFHVLMTFDNIANSDMNWFDLVKTDGDPRFDEIRPGTCEKIAGAVDMTTLASRAHSGASVTAAGANWLVQTAQARWAYAVGLAIKNGPLPAAPGWLAIDIAVERGVVGVGVLDRATGDCLAERQFGEGISLPSLPMPVFLPVEDLSKVGMVMVRNASVTGASAVVVRDLAIFRAGARS